MKITNSIHHSVLRISSAGMFVAMLAMGTFFSCSDEVTQKAGTGADSLVSEITPLPTTDQLDEKFEKKAMVFGDDRSGFNANVVNRLTDVTTELSSNVKAFVFTKGYTGSPTVDQVMTMFNAYRKNATFVLIDLERTDRTALIDTIEKAIDVASAKGQDVTLSTQMLARFTQFSSKGNNAVTGHCEAVAVNRNGTYIVPILEEMSKKQSDNAAIQQVTESGDTIRMQLAEQDYTPTGYDYGKSADMLVQWMTRCADAGSDLFATGANSDDTQLNAQMLTLQQTLGPTRALDRKMLYELNFEIYSFYKGDTDEDYYLVHCAPTFHASQLGCNQEKAGLTGTSYYWTYTDKAVTLANGTQLKPSSDRSTGCWYGPYMKAAQYTFKIESDGKAVSNATPLDPLPKGDVSGKATLTSGLKTTLTSVSLLDNSFWGGNDGRTVEMSQSFSHKNEGLFCMPNGGSSNWLEWFFVGTAPNRLYVPSTVNPLPAPKRTARSQKTYDLHTIGHTVVSPFQYNDFSEDMTFTFVVKNPDHSRAYNLRFTDMVVAGELYAEKINDQDVEALTWISNDQSIPLYQPIRKADYEIECSDPTFLTNMEQPIKDRLKEAFMVDWNGSYPGFSVYGANTEASLEKAKDTFANFSMLIYVVAGRYKIKDTYTFTLHAKGSKEKILSFQLVDGAIK